MIAFNVSGLVIIFSFIIWVMLSSNIKRSVPLKLSNKFVLN